MLIPKLQFLSLSGIENQEKPKPEARESGTHRLMIFSLVCFVEWLFIESERKLLICTKSVFVRVISSIPIVSFGASIRKKKTFAFKNKDVILF